MIIGEKKAVSVTVPQNQGSAPVFFDPNKKRWPKIKGGFYIAAILISIIFTLFFVSIIINPALDSLNLPSLSNFPHRKSLSSLATLLKKEKRTAWQRPLRRTRITYPSASQVKIPAGKVNSDLMSVGFFVDWDDNSFSSLKKNLGSLDVVIGEWLHLTPDGNINKDDPHKQDEVVNFIRQNKADTQIVPLLNNFVNNKWDDKLLASILASSTRQQVLIDQLEQYVKDNNFAGLSLDFESIPDSSQGDFLIFLKALGERFQAQGLKTYINVPADNDSFDYGAIAAASDYVIVMAYDENWATGTPGPIAEVAWFNDVLAARANDIPREKMIIALGNYGYDWQLDSKNPATAVTFEEGVTIARESEGNIALELESLNPMFDYADDNNKVHYVWMLDAITAFNQEQAVKNINARGVALWRLGSEDPALWSFFGLNNTPDQSLIQGMEQISFNYDVEYVGQGEILKVAQAPQSGQRQITFDAVKKIITNEIYQSYPNPYIIDRYGQQPKKIALTFDDGPDPVWTPKILEVLKKYQAPATFFVVGSNVEKNPDLLKQEFDQGNDVGNHSFTHPNIAEISNLQLRMEVSATERLLENIIGHGSHLFRPPYSEDSEPDNADQVRPIASLDQLGYLIVGIKIDPSDWLQPSAEQITQNVIKQAEKGNGNVVLLHDSGGERSQTVAALPLIIEQLRQRGYEFVTISQLLNMSQDKIMPPNNRDIWYWNDYFWFEIMSWVVYIFSLLFFLGIFMGLARFGITLVLALYNKFSKKDVSTALAASFSTAVIVPAYNEGKVIVKTINSLLAAEHPARFEVIVIDDGSEDDTWEILVTNFSHEPKIKLYQQLNSGKYAALNLGMTKTTAEIIIVLDADTIFAKDTITQLIKHFSNPYIGAVAGNAKVGNRNNWLTQWQALEYITSQNIDRRSSEALNCITVVPGAVGAWRHELISRLGGFNNDTLAEDADLTVRIIRAGFKVVYEDQAYGLTEAPDTISAFIKQRYRWMFGTFQVAWKNKRALFHPKERFFGFFALPNIFIFQIFFPLISPIADLMLLFSGISAIINKFQHPNEVSFANFQQILFYYAIFVVVDFLTALLAFLLESKENKKLLAWIIPQRFFYRQLIYFVAIKTLLSSLRGGSVGWNKLERKGTVGTYNK